MLGIGNVSTSVRPPPRTTDEVRSREIVVDGYRAWRRIASPETDETCIRAFELACATKTHAFIDEHGRYPGRAKDEHKLYSWFRYHNSQYDRYRESNPEIAMLMRSLPNYDTLATISQSSKRNAKWVEKFEKVKRIVDIQKKWPSPSSLLGIWIRTKLKQYLKSPDGEETRRQLAEWSKIPGWIDYIKNLTEYWKNAELFG